MDSDKIKDKVEIILDAFGMSGKKAAEFIGVSYDVFRQKKAGGKGNYFTIENYNSLVDSIKKAASNL